METEARLERFREADRWPTEEGLAAMLEHQQNAFAAVRAAIPQLTPAVRAAAERLRETGRLVYAGAGASGRLAVQDGVELWPTFGWPPARLLCLIAGGDAALTQSQEGAEDDGPAGAAAVERHGIGRSDVVIGVAASGTTRYTRGVIGAARHAGALTIALVNNPDAPLLDDAAFPVLLHTGPEFLAGSTRLAAGTAQKIALNLFSTRLMTELGRVHDGFMVHVAASNDKLVRRARRIVQAIAGGDAAAADDAYAAAGGSIPVAVLMLAGRSRESAERCLARADGHLRRALAEPGA